MRTLLAGAFSALVLTSAANAQDLSDQELQSALLHSAFEFVNLGCDTVVIKPGFGDTIGFLYNNYKRAKPTEMQAAYLENAQRLIGLSAKAGGGHAGRQVVCDVLLENFPSYLARR